MEILRNAGAKVVSPVGLASPEVLTHEGNTLITVACEFPPGFIADVLFIPFSWEFELMTLFQDHEFPEKVKDWISSFHDPNVKTLCDIVEWNESHHEEALPERKFLAGKLPMLARKLTVWIYSLYYSDGTAESPGCSISEQTTARSRRCAPWDCR